MPPYELAVIVRSALSRHDLKNVLRRSCETIWAANGVIRKIENLGVRSLPFRMKKDDEGHYFIMNLDLSPEAVFSVKKNLQTHDQLLRSNLMREEPPFQKPCLSGRECNFGELKIPDYEKKIHKYRNVRNVYRRERKEMNKALSSDRYQSVPID